jgi:protein-disulfide isomerase
VRFNGGQATDVSRALSNVKRVTPPPASTLASLRDGDHVAGSDAPELTLIEYGDFGCRFCFAANRPVMSLLERFDTLRLVWRHFPDAELHPGADLAAELSELAADHGKFWEAHSLLLAGREKFSREDLLSVVRRLELDGDEAEGALGERTFRERVNVDVAGGTRAGVHGTPTFFVDGERLDGPWRELAQIVPARLERTKR